jgi:glycosyltransferase involved in cell wall biosynthesis
VRSGASMPTQGDTIRIAMVHSFYSSAQPSGENTVVLNEVDALRRAGHEVALFAAHTDELEGEVFYKLRAGMRVATGYGRNPLKAIKDFSPDVVHVHNLFPNFGQRWVEDLDSPLVHTLHNYRPLCANGLLFREGNICTRCPDGERFASLRFRCYRGSLAATLPLTIGTAGTTSDDPLLARADRLLVLSSLQRDQYVRSGVSPDRLLVVSNFLPDSEDPGPSNNDRDGFVAVGRLAPEKGFFELAKIWPSMLPLTIAGDGPDRDRIEHLDNEAVLLVGRLARTDIIGLLGRAIALVFPSRWLEAAPLVHIEALAAATPVLAMDGNSVAAMVQEFGGGRAIGWNELAIAALDFPRDPALHEEARRVFETRHSEAAFLARATRTYGSLLEEVSAA